MSTVKDGKYPGKIKDYGLSPDKNGDLRVWVEFEIVNNEAATATEAMLSTVRWSNGLDTKLIQGKAGTFTSQSISLENLKKLGFNGGMPEIIQLYDGLESKALNPLIDVEIVMQGGYVKYINLPGEGPGKKFASKAEAVAALAKLGVAAGAPIKDYLK